MGKTFFTYLIIFVSLIFFVSSCTIGEVSETDEYASQEMIFDYSESALYEMLYSLDLSAKISAYSNASSDSLKQAIKKTYLSSGKISENSDGLWTLENNFGTWNFESNGLPIEQKGAVWEISLTKNSGKDSYITLGDFIITCDSSKQWTLEVKNIQSNITDRLKSSEKYDKYFSFKSYGEFSVTAATPDSIEPFYYDYTLESGNGGFIPDKVEAEHYNILVDYTQTSSMPLRYNTSKYIFASGSLSFDVKDSLNSFSETFDANIYTIPGDWNVSFK